MLDACDIGACIDLILQDHEHVATALRSAAPALEGFIRALLPRIQRGGRLIYLGAGTSGRLGVLDAAECPPTFQTDPNNVVGVIAGGDGALRRSSEAREDDPAGAAEALGDLQLQSDDSVLGIAAGGTTPYVLGGLRLAHARGAMTGLLCCAGHENLPPHCDHLIRLDTGAELLTGSTRLKAGTATKIALNTITTTLFVQLGKVYSNLMVDLRASNAKLTDRAIRILRELCPQLDRSAAADLLEAADGQLKVAIVMECIGIDAPEARKRIDACNGRLRPILEA
jgi:N-acetylmuramic acid 6-phosphate etherase